jgi:hypothetical protein
MTEGAAASLPELSGAEILEVDDIEVKRIDVPEWKSAVYLRVLPADEGLALNEKMQALEKGKDSEAMFLLLAATLVTSDKKPLFTAEQIAKVRGRSGKVLLRLQKEALQLQGWVGGGEQAKNA